MSTALRTFILSLLAITLLSCGPKVAGTSPKKPEYYTATFQVVDQEGRPLKGVWWQYNWPPNDGETIVVEGREVLNNRHPKKRREVGIDFPGAYEDGDWFRL